MSRPEKPINLAAGPVAEFACRLRELRAAAGGATYRAMAENVHYSAAVLSRAANGTALPAWPVVKAYVYACGGDEAEWRVRWDDLQTAVVDIGRGSRAVG